MKIVVEYSDPVASDKILEINSAKYLSDYVIRVEFSDGIEKLIEFKPFLTKSLHPSILKYKDEKKFSNFSIQNGNLNWNDYDLIFPISELYKGEITR